MSTIGKIGENGENQHVFKNYICIYIYILYFTRLRCVTTLMRNHMCRLPQLKKNLHCSRWGLRDCSLSPRWRTSFQTGWWRWCDLLRWAIPGVETKVARVGDEILFQDFEAVTWWPVNSTCFLSDRLWLHDHACYLHSLVDTIRRGSPTTQFSMAKLVVGSS